MPNEIIFNCIYAKTYPDGYIVCRHPLVIKGTGVPMYCRFDDYNFAEYVCSYFSKHKYHLSKIDVLNKIIEKYNIDSEEFNKLMENKA